MQPWMSSLRSWYRCNIDLFAILPRPEIDPPLRFPGSVVERPTATCRSTPCVLMSAALCICICIQSLNNKLGPVPGRFHQELLNERDWSPLQSLTFVLRHESLCLRVWRIEEGSGRTTCHVMCCVVLCCDAARAVHTHTHTHTHTCAHTHLERTIDLQISRMHPPF